MSQLYARHMELLAAGGLQATSVDNNFLSVLLDTDSGLSLAATGLSSAQDLVSTGAGVSMVNAVSKLNGTDLQMRSLTSAGGTLTITQPNADEINIETNITIGRFRGTYDPGANGNALPTAATSTVGTGDAILAGDYWLFSAPGAVGGTATATVNDLFIAEADGAAADADFTLIDGSSVSNFVPISRTLTGGDGVLINGVSTAQDLSADRTISLQAADDSLTVAPAGASVQVSDGLVTSVGNGLQVQPDAATGGTTIPVSVTANGVGVDVAGIDHDALTNFVANEHIDHSSVSVAAGGDDGILVANDDLTANIGIAVDITGTTAIAANAVEDADEVLIYDTSASALRKITRSELIGVTGRTVEYFTLTGGNITGGVTIAATPADTAQVTADVRGGSMMAPTTDFTVAATLVTFTAAQQARLAVGDVVRVEYAA